MSQLAPVPWGNRAIDIEYQWVGAAKSDYPVLVFLHEGLGSVALWKNFPEKFCRAYGLSGLVFSRYGYGLSTARPADEKWPRSYMHDQACQVLPALFNQLGISKPVLFGHSDGGSIALLYAAHFPDQVCGVIVAAPHILVEDISIASIEKAREMYLTGSLRKQLKKYHADVDSAFWGWNDIWLNPDFRAWNIRSELSAIRCPVLAIQGEQDPYGTLQQITGIQRQLPEARLVILPNCGHTPHQDQPDVLFEEASAFILRLAGHTSQVL